MTINHLHFCSRAEAESATPDPDIAVISITDPVSNTCKPATLRDGWHSVLRLEFHDIDLDQIVQPFLRAQVKRYYTLMSPDQARQVVAFVGRVMSNGASGLMVHCEAGESRSAAVAKWIGDRYGLRLAAPGRNLHVYRMLEAVGNGQAERSEG
jgi:predicted protein tyrosine phosphatase